ncbi:MAG: amidohydrolase [Chloroflexota bacterium]|nr:amidohydrolase [Chloroflexota bacterium]
MNPGGDGRAGPAHDRTPAAVDPASVATTTVDVHAHVIVPEVAGLVRNEFEPRLDPFLRYGGVSTAYNDGLATTLVPLLTDPALRLATMDRQGVACQAVSIAPPQYHYWARPELGAEIARVQNDAIAALAAAHPGRIVGLGTLPMQAPGHAVRELDRVVAVHGFRGVSINPSAEGRDYDEPAYDPFWQRVEELDVVVVLHPNGFADGRRLSRYYMINVVGNPMETTVALSRLILGGVLERHPGLKIVAVHGGGYLPFYMDRMDHAYECRPEVRERISRKPSEYLRELYFDSVVFGAGLNALVDLVGPDHVLLGTDYPFDMGEPDPIGHIGRVAGLSEDARRAMTGGTAARLLRLPM